MRTEWLDALDWYSNDVHIIGEGEPVDDGFQEEDLYSRIILSSREPATDMVHHYLSRTTDLEDQAVEHHVERLSEQYSL